MSGGNGILIRKVSDIGEHEFFVYEYDASSGEEIFLKRFGDLEEALEYASDYPSEYGVTYENVNIDRKIETTLGEVRAYFVHRLLQNFNLSGVPDNAEVTIEWKE